MDDMQAKIEQIKLVIAILRALINFAQKFFPAAPDVSDFADGDFRYTK